MQIKLTTHNLLVLKFWIGMVILVFAPVIITNIIDIVGAIGDKLVQFYINF